MEVISFNGALSARVTKIKVRRNELVAKDQILLLYDSSPGEDSSSSSVGDGKFRAKFLGSVVNFLVKEGDTIQEGTPLFSMSRGCPHAVVMKDMCADCGSDLRLDGQRGVRMEKVTAAVPMVHSIPELIVSNEQAEKLGQDDVTRMLKARRLALLVDLDQTLIHTTTDNVSNQVADIHHFQLHGPKSPWYHTKLRPGTVEFLADIKKCYELHICTFGTRMYAHQIAKILDPDGALFSHRILSRDELLDPFLKTANMKSLFPCGDQMVCIIDDREDVWNYSPNLVHVKPYHYFKNVGDINAPFPKVLTKTSEPGRSENLLSASSSNGKPDRPPRPPPESVRHQYESRFGDEGQEESDDYLLYLKQTLTTIHDAFYQLYDENADRSTSDDSSLADGEDATKKEPDLKNIVPYVRKKVLQGCNIVFTGLFPHDVQSDEKSKALSLAKSFGAEVTDDLVTKEMDEGKFTTHLVAAKDGTVKVTTARKTGYIYIVAPDWLTESIRRWEKVDERLYPLTETTKGPEAFLRDYQRPRPNSAQITGSGTPSNAPATDVPSTSSSSAEEVKHQSNMLSNNDSSKAKRDTLASLSGLSADILHNMEDEIDDAMGDGSSSSSSEDEEDIFRETNATTSKKRKRDDLDLESDNDDEEEEDEDERDAKFLKSEELKLSSESSSSSDEEHRFSDDDEDDDDSALGELADALDRQLSEE